MPSLKQHLLMEIFICLAISVMLLHGAGCEYLKELVLIFASFLNANGFNVRLDLLETNLVAQMSTASYYESVERESDYVIIICSDVSGVTLNPFEISLIKIRTKNFLAKDLVTIFSSFYGFFIL